MTYLAHTCEDGRTQTIVEHAEGVAKLARGFADVFGSAETGKCLGLLHDLGKYRPEFQQYLRSGGAARYKTEHTGAGANLLLDTRMSGLNIMMAYCIMGHHTGLPDGGKAKTDPADSPTLYGRKKRPLPDLDGYREEISAGLAQPIANCLPRSHPAGITLRDGFSVAFYTRMLFSCLTDADFLDTERFMQNGLSRRDTGEGIAVLRRKLQHYLRRFGTPQTELNCKRTEILHLCIEKAALEPGLYTLTVPTGGGKTLSSVAFALEHAAQHQMWRIIYAIPYTSIIEQNARIFRNIFGTRNVLEHHSSFEYDDHGEEMDSRRLAAENWDMPLVVTTNVQFFESLFANKSSRCRKLHNIAGSVIVFDEAQCIPLPYLKPCLRAIEELVNSYHCTVVLCSATQPALEQQFQHIPCNEICENVPELYQFFRRTRIVQDGELDNAALASRLADEQQALCIVNTRRHAQDLFHQLPPDGSWHLSTLLYPKHRARMLWRIRRALKKGLPCRVVSTSLIEAGVDVDFPTVYRARTGLDSEIQAAGRCNREGNHSAENSIVHIFREEEHYLPKRRDVSREKARASLEDVERRFDDVATPEAIRAYFKGLYFLKTANELDQNGVIAAFNQGREDCSLPFRTVAENFHLIESDTRSVFIPFERKAARIAEKLRAGERSRELFRQASRYSVHIRIYEFDGLRDAGKLEVLESNFAILLDPEAYSAETGLTCAATAGDCILA